jgi:hypothetical protein
MVNRQSERGFHGGSTDALIPGALIFPRGAMQVRWEEDGGVRAVHAQGGVTVLMASAIDRGALLATRL